MSIGQILQQLILGPIELLLDVIYAFALRKTGSIGGSIIILSLAVNLLLLPLYKRADALQKEERDRAARMKPRIDQIREVFTGSERFMILQTYYRQNHYKPYYALKGSVSLLLQIPFFMAAYRFLSGLQVLQEVPFGPIRNLGAPDGILQIGGTAINLLPVLMTAINILSGMLYSRDMPLKSKIQMYGLALVFLVLLYRSPAGLVFYWTLNNLFSLGKNALSRLPHKPVPKIRMPRAITGKLPRINSTQSKWIFRICCVFLALLTGLLIPSEVIKSSPDEFVDPWRPSSPVAYLLSPALLAAGFFLIWCSIYFHLLKEKNRQTFAIISGAAAAAGTVNFMAFGNSYGDMSAMLTYERGPSVAAGQWLFNIAVILVVFVLTALLIRKLPGLMRSVYLACCVALAAMSVMNISAIQQNYRSIADAPRKEAPTISLSRSGKNVVVIMLDRAVGGFPPYIFHEKPGLLQQFDGFTYYPNTLSFGFHTNVASPALYGGYEYTPDEMNARDDMLLVDKHNEALKVMPVLFLENGYDVTVIDPSLANYKWISDMRIYDDYPDIHGFNAQGYFDENVEDTRQYTDQIRNRNLFCYSIFRISPLLFHAEMYDDGDYNQTDLPRRTRKETDSLVGVNPSFLKNYWVMQNLTAITKVRSSPENCFLMMATEETHDITPLQEPDYTPKLHVDNTAYEADHGIRTAADGSELDIGSAPELEQSHYQCNMAAFIQLGRWFDELRKQGIWDNTRIILVSDHSYSLNLLGFDLADRYPEASESSWINGEPWTITSAYEPLLMVKDFNATGFSTDTAFMTNADTPVLAFSGTVDHPVNPFTGNPIVSDPKYAGELHLMETDWHFVNNDGFTFSDPRFITFRNQDITNPDNWYIEDWEQED